MVYSPALLSIGEAGEVILAFITGVVAVVALATAVQGYLFTRLTMLERFVSAIAAASLLHGDWKSDVLGAVLLGLVIAIQIFRTKNVSVS